jgi:hypothetical protein
MRRRIDLFRQPYGRTTRYSLLAHRFGRASLWRSSTGGLSKAPIRRVMHSRPNSSGSSPALRRRPSSSWAETLYVHFLVASSIGGPRKRNLIGLVLSWSPESVTVPPELDEALDHGLAKVGTAFNTYRPFQLHLIIEAVRAWKMRPEEEQQALLGDPWAFKEFLFSIQIHAAYSQREALLHLVFPDTFEDIVSRDHKRLIAEAFRQELPAPEEDVDRALLMIRRNLEEKQHGRINFYEHGFVEIWQPPDEPAMQVEEVIVPRGAWLVRGTDAQGRTLVDRWLS